MPRFELSDVGDSDSDGEVELPHPLGFGGPSSPWGKTWISLDPPSRSQYSGVGRSRYALEDDDEEDFFVQSFPPISTYISSERVSTAALLRIGKETESEAFSSPRPRYHRRSNTDDDLCYSSAEEDEEHQHNKDIVFHRGHDDCSQRYSDRTDENSDIALLLQQSYKPSSPLLKDSTCHSFASPQEIRNRRDETNRRIQRRMEAERRRIDEEFNRTAAILGELVLQSKNEADTILQKKRSEEEELQKAQAAREERERKIREKAEQEAALRKKEAALRKEQADKKASEQQAERQAHNATKKKKQQESETRAKKKTEHIDKAKKLVGQLVQVRASVEPFEKNKTVGKRRLGMKKIAKGKVNTLNDNPGKIQEVATEISQAIARYDQEDAQIKQQLQQKVAGITPDMAVGRRYFVDLLASTAMMRVQAESFSGTKGDSFPLAAMLAMVSVENKNITAVLAAHIYTVCPTAIPTIPTPKADASEDEVMIGLGMQRNKKTGEFETFPQFLGRTENIVSFMAAIQSSLPSSHQLMGGNTGALLWLKRFLDLLPPAPMSPLPLTTAPVLGAFLIGAGHMLARVHPENFRKLLGKVESDIVHRLDEGEIGKPSAIRLTKVLEGGFDSFSKSLPAKAVKGLYCGASENSQKNEVVTSFGGTIGGEEQVQPKRDMTQPLSQQQQNPFGGSSGGSSGFLKSNSKTNPFGGGNSVPNQSSTFGGAAAPSPFGGGAASSSSPFGAGAVSSSSPSPFGSGAAPSPSPFGSGAASSPSPFGGGAAASPSPFGSGAAPSPSPFGSSAASSPSPFGGGATASSSPFGGGAAPSPSPFGGGAVPSPSPFGGGAAPSPSPFGGGMTPAPSPFGGTTAPSPSPFGGTAAPSPSPFGGNSAPSASPFGGNSNFNSNPSPFGGGNTTQQNSPFGGGGNSQQSPFDGGGGRKKGQSRNNTTFGSNNNNQGFGSNAGFGSSHNNQGVGSNNGGRRNNGGFGSNSSGRANNGGFESNKSFGGGIKNVPCKFFAQGRCKKGNNCQFSHDGGGGGGGGNNNNWNSFGGPRR